ncbi:hypothetical protein HPP92_006057 [Vanilla planifolia]|uniref:Myb-like domain-containing protein n=1 Tax=Vanilla planifolia TaxID=51239 RepID=A0A835RNY9_VANPL|nr:hypothetical protein HPP92_006057 [Vanilla planifolia]
MAEAGEGAARADPDADLAAGRPRWRRARFRSRRIVMDEWLGREMTYRVDRKIGSVSVVWSVCISISYNSLYWASHNAKSPLTSTPTPLLQRQQRLNMHNRFLIVADDPCQVAFEHIKQLERDCYVGASAETTSFIPVSGKQEIADGIKEDLNSKLGSEIGQWYDSTVFLAPVDKVSAASVPFRAVNCSWYAENTKEIVCLENAKRPFGNCCSEQEVCKRARQEEKIGRCLETPINVVLDRKLSSETGERTDAAGLEGNVKTLGSNLICSGSSCKTIEEEASIDQLRLFSSCSGYYENGQQRSRSTQLEDFYTPFSDFCHWRRVPIGPDHQANIPECRTSDRSGNCGDSYWKVESSSSSVELDDTTTYLGTQILPMPHGGLISRDDRICGYGSGFDCLDEGSIICVREHIMRARKSLESSLGHEKFVALGFSDMGEVVAQRWTEEEENMFREVVLSSPASLGRNFWPVLSQAFPSRSSKELVSYYFNVFMLQKRSEQNRSDPLNVDSDNDEWQEISDVEEYTMSGEEEENSLVESPTEGHEDYGERFVNSDEDEFYSGSDGWGDFGLDSKCFKNHLGNVISADDADDPDIQDDSCTSFEGQFHAADTCHGHVKLHAGYEGHGDSKLWETNYIGTIEKEIEFLPTSHVIEELLGNECLKDDDTNGCH